MDENLEKAKKLLFDYACSPYFMARDGMDGQYKSYGPTKELEAEWRAEYIAHWISQLSLDDFHALGHLEHAWAYEAIPDLTRMCNQAEGYAKLEYADAIYHLSKDSNLDNDTRQKAQETAIKAWEDLVPGNFTVPEQFHKQIVAKMTRADTTTPENYVINQATKQLQEAKKKK